MMYFAAVVRLFLFMEAPWSLSGVVGFVLGPTGITTDFSRPLVRSPHHQRCCSFSSWILQAADGSSTEDYSAKEITDMEELIISISKEATDASRRVRLAALFDDNLVKPNGAPKRFCTLFDNVLVIVGDRVKMEAQQKALALQGETAEAASSSGEAAVRTCSSDENESTFQLVQTTPEGWQLWALIDMMVQSKTIVKKASGELGKDSSFG